VSSWYLKDKPDDIVQCWIEKNKLIFTFDWGDYNHEIISKNHVRKLRSDNLNFADYYLTQSKSSG